MTEEWVVEIEVVGPGDPVNDERLDDLMDVLEPFSAVVTGTPEEPADGNARYGSSLTVLAETADAAVITGLEMFRSHAEKVGLPGLPVVRLATMTAAEQDADLARPNFPTLLGVAELAGLLGVSKQRASELARTETFPRPLFTLASGPVWVEPAVLRFVQSWDRRPGRPARAG